jgi:hypothetical protein
MSNWKNFKLDEFKCKHCGENEIEYELIDKLQLLREDLGFPFIISSGYRCEHHPIEKKKSKPGTHNLGRTSRNWSSIRTTNSWWYAHGTSHCTRG